MLDAPAPAAPSDDRRWVQVVRFIEAHPDAPLREIADALGIDSSTASRAIDRAVLHGVLVRNRLGGGGPQSGGPNVRYTRTETPIPAPEDRRPETVPAGPPSYVDLYRKLIDRPARPSLVLRARVVAAIQRAGITLSETSRRIGLAENALSRRLHPDGDRELTVQDLDRIVQVLDLEPDTFSAAVLLPGDLELLTAIGQAERFGDGDLLGGHPAPEPLTDAPARLLAQDLCVSIEIDGASFLALRPAGLSALADPTLRNC